MVIFVYKTHYVWSLSLKVPSGWSRPWADGCLSVNYWRIERVIKCDAARRPIHRECNDCRSRALQLTEWNYNGACCTESRKAFQVNTLAEEEAPWAAGGSWRAAGGSQGSEKRSWLTALKFAMALTSIQAVGGCLKYCMQLIKLHMHHNLARHHQLMKVQLSVAAKHNELRAPGINTLPDPPAANLLYLLHFFTRTKLFGCYI